MVEGITKTLEISGLPLQPCSHSPRAHFISIHLTSLSFLSPLLPHGLDCGMEYDDKIGREPEIQRAEMFHQEKGGKWTALQVILEAPQTVLICNAQPPKAGCLS